MVAADFFENLKKLEIFNYVGVEDKADQLSFLYTVCIFLICTLIATSKMYFTKAISCLLVIRPNHATGLSFENYAENHCWTRGTYPVPSNFFDTPYHSAHVPLNTVYARERVYYYQWVPFVLGLQGILCNIPRIVWHMITRSRTGTDVRQLVQDSHRASLETKEDVRDGLITHVAKTLHTICFEQREQRQLRGCQLLWKRVTSYCAGGSKSQGTALVAAYIFVKFLYILNAVGQIYVMEKFLQMDNKTEYSYFGYTILRNLISGKFSNESAQFPRLVMCNIKIYEAASLNVYTAQCALPANMYFEMIYVFLWFWLIFVAIVSIVNTLVWIIRMGYLKQRTRFIRRYLRPIEGYKGSEKKDINLFVKDILRYDGAFLIRMLQINIGDLTTRIIVKEWYKIYGARQRREVSEKTISERYSTNTSKTGGSNPNLKDQPMESKYSMSSLENHNRGKLSPRFGGLMMPVGADSNGNMLPSYTNIAHQDIAREAAARFARSISEPQRERLASEGSLDENVIHQPADAMTEHSDEAIV